MATRLVTVVGVARDVAGFRITGTKEAGIFLPTSVNAPKTSVAARVNGDSELARRGCSFCHDSDRFAHRAAIAGIVRVTDPIAMWRVSP
jgi:hypothetical protein